MKKVLVTGASGALGRAVIAKLRQLGTFSIIAAGRIPDQNEDVDEYRVLDLQSSNSIYELIQQVSPDLVLNLAASFSVDFDEAYRVNVDSTRHLLDAIGRFCPAARILLIGSAAEYGVVKPEENPLKEDHALNPVSVYGLSKVWQSQLAGLYANRGISVVLARIFNLDGPGLSDRLFVGRLQKQIAELERGERLTIELGSLAATRDYISIAEAATQIMAIALHGEVGVVYHVASGEGVTMREMLNRYLSLHALDATVVREAAELTNHIGYDVPVIYADVGRTRKLLAEQEAGRGKA